MEGILIKGPYPIKIAQCTVNGRIGSSVIIGAPIAGFTKRFIARVKYGL